MEPIFVNYSNHPSGLWEKEQTQEAERMGRIVDMPFPHVDPLLSEEEVRALGDQAVEEIMDKSPAAVMCQGEFTLCQYVVEKLKERGVKVVAACSARETFMDGDKKISRFYFVKFRRYL